MSNEEVQWYTKSQIVDGHRWIIGRGNLPADVMFIYETPDFVSRDAMVAYMGEPENRILGFAAQAGIDTSNAYLTYAVKYIPKGKKPAKSGDHKKCRPYLLEEIRRCQPKLIVSMGSSGLKMLFDNRYKITDYRGSVLELPEVPGCKVLVTYAPNYIARNPHMESLYLGDWKQAGDIYRGVAHVKADIKYEVHNNVKNLHQLVDTLIATPNVLSLDCEWHGKTWMDPERYIRMVQFRWDREQIAIVEFYSEGVTPEGEIWKPEYKKQEFDDIPGGWRELKRLFEHPNIKIMGHNVIADGEWLLSYGIDIRPRVIVDTMLNEYMLNELGPFGLDALSCKYTPYGKYDSEVTTWINHHKDECADGFGPVPRPMLLPYAAKDVEVPALAAEKQLPLMTYTFKARGIYPSLFQTTMDTQRNIYEMELTGMRVDLERLQLMANAYIPKLGDLENKLKLFAASIGMEEFNYRSVEQVRTLLFEKLKLTPIKTTDDKEWAKAILSLGREDQKEVAASTDKTSLMILQGKHPAVKQLLNIRRVDTIVKTFLKEDEEADENSRGGGLFAKIWPDGRFHTRFSQLTDTGRFKHRRPNSSNFAKKAEGYLKEIFGDQMPPPLRTVVIPSDGYVIMEADFKQAELFVLAWLSDDKNMKEALTTPGKDLHDNTAISSFDLRIFNANGVELTADDMVRIAKTIDNQELFEEHFLPTLTYQMPDGKTLTRKQFKSGIRISAKNINFGT